MPLVVPNTNDGDKTSQWLEKLAGKKIGDQSNETVRISALRLHGITS